MCTYGAAGATPLQDSDLISGFSRFCGGVEAQADVVGGPVAVGVAEDGFEQSDGAGESCCAVVWGEAVEDAIAEGVEP